MRKTVLMFMFVFCFGLLVPGCSQGEPKVAPPVNAGTWFNTDGFSLENYKDKIVVVEFWATWCPPCRQSIPHLKKLYEEYSDKGVVMVSLTNESASTIEKFMKKVEMPWIIGAESQTGSAYGVTGIPTAFIVSNGQIVWTGHPMDGLDSELKKLVEEAANQRL